MLRTPGGQWASPVHAALMGDGTIVFVGTSRAADPPTATTPTDGVSWTYTPPALGASLPASSVIEQLAMPLELDGVVSGDAYIADDLICMGAAHTADGRLLGAGGTRFVQVLSTGEQVVFGLTTQVVYSNKTWSRLPGAMVGTGPYTTPGRWYPTVMRLPDARMMTMGGHEFVATSGLYPNLSVETLDLSTNSRAVYSPFSSTSSLLVAQDYTHTFVLPTSVGGADVIMIGEFGYPVLANSRQTGGWVAGRAPRPGSTGDGINWGVSTAMLPIRVQDGEWGYGNGSVLLASGKMGTPAQHQVDVFDPTASPGWRPSIDLTVNRHHPSAILLPDGRTLIVNGHDMNDDRGVLHTQYVDPRNGFAVSSGASSSGVIRGYHSIALLLPDGRVLVGGGRDQDTHTSLEKPTLQYYMPDYLSKPRPVITSAPAAIGFGGSFPVSVTGPKPAEVVLMALGSMTHSIDMDQRSVQLAATVGTTGASGTTMVTVAGPPNSQVAPPGDYMLFVLDANRVPSVAKIVRLA